MSSISNEVAPIPPPEPASDDPPAERSVEVRPVPHGMAVSAIALHAWLERHRDDAVSSDDEGRYELYLKGPTGFCA